MLKQLLFSAAVAAMAISASAESKVLWTADDPEGEPIEGWYEFLALTPEEASVLNAGDVISVTVTAKGTEGWPQVALFEGGVDWPPMTNAGVGEAPSTVTMSITYDMAQKIHENGASIRGESLYISEISYESSPVNVGPYTIWFGPKQCGWGDGFGISNSVFENVEPYQQLVLEYDPEAGSVLQFLFGGWEGANIASYQAWMANFMNVDETAGTMTITLLPELSNLIWGEEGKEQEYDLFTLLKEGGLVVHGTCTVNQLLYLPKQYGQYDMSLAEINACQAQFEEALAQVSADAKNPDFNPSQWETAINNEISQARTDLLDAFNAALANGIDVNYTFDSRKISNMIDAMIAASQDTSGVQSVATEVAAGKAQIFTLDGKQHKAPVKGEVNVIVRENSTSKVYINK